LFLGRTELCGTAVLGCADRYEAALFTHERWELPPRARDIVLQACKHFDGDRLVLHAAVVMPDHVHVIIEFLKDDVGDDFTFEQTIGAIKGFSAHAINKELARKGSVWLDESFDHVARCEESVEQKIEYICQNPVRRGLVRLPSEYRWLYVKGAQPRTAVPH
jgi:REP element-mobilizing transposase RayT